MSALTNDLGHACAKASYLYERGKRRGAAKTLRQIADAMERKPCAK